MSEARMDRDEVFWCPEDSYGLLEICGVSIESEEYVIFAELCEKFPTMSAQSERRIYEDSFFFVFGREKA